MTHFRKRLDEQVLREINGIIAVEAAKATQESDRDDEPKSGTKPKRKRTTKRRPTSEGDQNQSVLLLDATCAPADVAHPTDLNLLNEARENRHPAATPGDEPRAQVARSFCPLVNPNVFREKSCFLLHLHRLKTVQQTLFISNIHGWYYFNRRGSHF
jgi:hypothetical protein